MKKLLTLALAIVALAAFTSLSVGQGKQQVMTGKVLSVNAGNKTLAIEVTFSTKNLKDTFPEAGKIYDIT